MFLRLALFLAMLAAVPARASVIDLGTLGGPYSFARDMNASAVIVGESKTVLGHTHAFVWANGEMIDLGSLKDEHFSMANGVNDDGSVVGYGRPSADEGDARALLWDKAHKVSVLKHLPGQSYSQASDLNNQGDVVGVSGTKAVIWIEGKPKELKSLGGDYSIALGINKDRMVVGNSLTKDDEVHAVLWKDGKTIDLGTLGGRFSTANAINDKGEVVGTSETPEGAIHSFFWKDGMMKDLGVRLIRNLSPSGLFAGEVPTRSLTTSFAQKADTSLEQLKDTLYSSAFGVNDLGLVCGVSEIRMSLLRNDKSSSVFHATLWMPKN